MSSKCLHVTTETAWYDGFTPDDYAALLTGVVDEYLDADGRPIGEVRASASVRAGILTEHKRCPWSGSRHHHVLPMNVSALRQTTRDWPQILGALDVVRAAYVARHPRREPTLIEHWRLAATMSLLPAYLMFRADAPFASGRVPAFVASINKMVGGIMSLAARLALRELTEGRPLDGLVVTPALLVAAAEETGSLIGSAEVCAATPAMLAEILGALDAGVRDGEVDREAIRTLLPAPGAFLDYAEAATELTLVLYVLSLQFGVMLGALGEDLAPDGSGPVAAALAATTALPFFGRFTLGLPVVPGAAHHLAPIVRVDIATLLDDVDPPEVAIAQEWRGARGVAAPLLPRLARDLTIHLQRERNALAIVERLRARIHTALGRPAPARELDGPALSRLFGVTPTAFFEAVLDIEITNGTARTR